MKTFETIKQFKTRAICMQEGKRLRGTLVISIDKFYDGTFCVFKSFGKRHELVRETSDYVFAIEAFKSLISQFL